MTASSVTATQNHYVLGALRKGRGISPIDALKEFGVFRLAARIYELRTAGHRIVTTYDTDGHKHWAVYYLIREAR